MAHEDPFRSEKFAINFSTFKTGYCKLPSVFTTQTKSRARGRYVKRFAGPAEKNPVVSQSCVESSREIPSLTGTILRKSWVVPVFPQGEDHQLFNLLKGNPSPFLLQGFVISSGPFGGQRGAATSGGPGKFVPIEHHGRGMASSIFVQPAYGTVPG
jgi:hypothetical protein